MRTFFWNTSLGGFKQYLLAAALLFGWIVLSSGATVSAQESKDVESLQQEFNKLEEELRGIALKTQRLGIEYINAVDSDTAFGLFDKYEENLKAGNQVLEKWVPIGKQLFEQKLQQKLPIDNGLTLFITKLMIQSFDEGQYMAAYDLCQQLYKNNPQNKFAEIYTARTGMLTNQFGPKISGIIQANADYFQKEEAISETEKMLVSTLYYLESIFAEELKLREKDAKAGDLPRVEFKTNKGDFVVELFEDEAPETVGNFISLVESKHYDGLVFHTVISQTAAESGLADETGRVRGIGYTIYDENKKPAARKIFAGSLAMYRDLPNTAGSRFFVAMAALPSMNEKHTVFGRVVSGMDAIYRLNKTYKFEEEKQIKIEDVVPDKVLSAKVLRKRDHEYVPRKVEK